MIDRLQRGIPCHARDADARTAATYAETRFVDRAEPGRHGVGQGVRAASAVRRTGRFDDAAGGPAIGRAFEPLFERTGVRGAESIALGNALTGLVCGSILGAPLSTVLMERFDLQPRASAQAVAVTVTIVLDEDGPVDGLDARFGLMKAGEQRLRVKKLHRRPRFRQCEAGVLRSFPPAPGGDGKDGNRVSGIGLETPSKSSGGVPQCV
jgi:hypothetical protein